jgi:hypothetical protein
MDILGLYRTHVILFSIANKFRCVSPANTILLPQDHHTGITLPSFKKVIIELEPHDTDEYSLFHLRDCNLYIDPVSGENNPEMLFFPESLKDFVSTGISNDTLKIRLDMWNLCRKYKSEEHDASSISGINLRFVIAEIDVVNKLLDLSITIKNIETDRIKVDSYGNIRIDSCKAEVIEPLIRTGYHKLIVENYLNNEFPNLLSYKRFVELEHRFFVPMVLYLKLICFGECTGITYVDSTCIRVCHNKRIKRNKVFKDLAEVGKSTMGCFFGFKLHPVCNEKGELLNLCLTRGNVDERT